MLAALLAAITFSHYMGQADQPSLLAHLVQDVGLSRFDLERILYLAPIIWSGFLFGRRGVLLVSALALMAMLPRVVFISPHPAESLFETGAVFVVGGWAGLSAAMLMEERDRHIQLATLYRVSSDVARSLDLQQILSSSVRSVVEGLRLDAAMVFLLDGDSGDLVLTSHHGLAAETAAGLARLSADNSLNGIVARTGEPLYVADSLNDPRLHNKFVRQAGIRSQVIVPVRAKGSVLGTLCVASCSLRRFRPGEVELLAAIGNHLGVALEKARLYAERERMEENLHYYLQQITRAQEEERKRIARELHDETIQALVIHSRHLDELASDEGVCSMERLRARLEELYEETNEIIQGVRRLSRDLRPATLDRLGLLPALERLAADVVQDEPLQVEVRTVGRERRLSDEAAIALFRIAQEALNNVRRHARATHAEVVVEFLENRVRLTVRDDGKGFACPKPLSALPRDGKLGLAGMEERVRLLGGTVEVDSEPGRGTRVTVEAPL